jgi:hypothetical protein
VICQNINAEITPAIGPMSSPARQSGIRVHPGSVIAAFYGRDEQSEYVTRCEQRNVIIVRAD